MIKGLKVICALLAFSVAPSVVLAEPPGSAIHSSSELKSMLRSAHTVQDYSALATYFRGRQSEFEQQAQSEKIELDRRSMNPALVAAKYPNPVASSRNRYEYFTYEAQQMGQQAAHYEQLSASAAR
jgi:hypothetical protein